MLLFLIGITIGIIYTIIAHKREVDKLNESLKQTQKLVQDLHKEEEEVEMKDSLNLKELSNLGFEFQGTDQTVDDDAEAMSKIEAELLAELELLELNVKAYSLSRTPDIVEVIMHLNHFNYAAYYWLTILQKGLRTVCNKQFLWLPIYNLRQKMIFFYGV